MGDAIEEHRLSVSRSARYYTLGEAGASTRQVWIACHGYGQLAARFLSKLQGIAGERRYLVAPEGLSRFYLGDRHGLGARLVGAAWMTSEDRLAEVADYVGYLDAVYADVCATVDRSRVRVHVLGFSQGAATVSRWAALGTARVDRLVLWGGEFPPDLDLTQPGVLERLRAAGVTLVHGRSDEFITPKVAETMKARLGMHDIPCVDVPFDGGHEITQEVLKELAA